jgi:hypothetical protein
MLNNQKASAVARNQQQSQGAQTRVFGPPSWMRVSPCENLPYFA